MKEETIILGGGAVHYKIVGAGPTILILHGWGSRSDRWIEVANMLSQQNFSVVLPDLPGFGKSSIPPAPWGPEDYCNFVEQFVQKIGLQNFCLLGHSFGGGVALLYAIKHAEQVQKLFLVAAALRRKNTAKKQFFLGVAKIGKIFSFLPLYPLFRKVFYRFIVRRSDYLYQKGVMKESFLKVIGQDLSAYVPQVKASTFIFWGEKDDVVPIADAYFIKQNIPGAILVTFPEGNHDIEQHMPDELAKHITKFCYSNK